MLGSLPDDDNGAVLRRMQENGDDLTKPRDVEFTVVFQNQASAEEFADYFRRLGHESSLERTECVPDLPWDVVVVKHLLPTHDEITRFENALQLVASALGGRNDGWGCVVQG